MEKSGRPKPTALRLSLLLVEHDGPVVDDFVIRGAHARFRLHIRAIREEELRAVVRAVELSVRVVGAVGNQGGVVVPGGARHLHHIVAAAVLAGQVA